MGIVVLLRIALLGAIAFLAFGIVGCTLIPNDGPSSRSYRLKSFDHVTNRGTDRLGTAVDFILVDVNKQIVSFLRESQPPSDFAGAFTDRGPRADIRIGVGDTLSMTIFESGAGGLFTPTGVTLTQGNFVNLPNQEVDGSGRIKAPYAGWIQAVGRRAEELEREIEKKLDNRAIEPQVVINVVTRTSNLISVLGDVNTAGRFNITLDGTRVLDGIGLAEGAQFQDYETLVTLQRNDTEATVRLSAITRNTANNIYLHPRDTLFVQRDQRFFTVFGATTEQARLTFDQEQQAVADGLARVGGMQDFIADARWLVLYRPERRQTLEAMGANIPEQYAESSFVPVVYRFNLRNPEGFFFAKNIYLQNKDLLYVSNAPIIGWLKLNGIIRDYNATIVSSKLAKDAIRVWHQLPTDFR